jgi:hypothetical protein
MFERPAPTPEKADRSFLAYSALMLCFFGLLLGGVAIRSNREEVMMRTMPATAATVLSLRPTCPTSAPVGQIEGLHERRMTGSS